MTDRQAKTRGRGTLAALLLLLPLAAIPAFRAEASRANVWEPSSPASLTATKTDAAGPLASLAPAAAADAEPTETPRFDFGDVVLADTADADAEHFDLGPLTIVDLNLLRGPPPSYPETRVGGFELLPPFRVEASPSLSLWSRQACGFVCREVASDSRYDPWGLQSDESAPGPVNRFLDWLAETPVGRGARWVGGKVGEVSSMLGEWAGQEAGRQVAPKSGVDPQVGDLHSASEMPDSRGMQAGMQPGRSLKAGLQRDVADVTEAAVTNAVEQGTYWAGAAVLKHAAETLGTVGRGVIPEKRIERLSKPGRAMFEGMEVRGVRGLSHVDESTLRAMAEEGFAAKDAKGRKLYLHHVGQNPAGPVVEVPSPYHNIGNKTQHPRGNVRGAGLSAEQRAAFDSWREDYWRARASEELERRGLR